MRNRKFRAALATQLFIPMLAACAAGPNSESDDPVGTTTAALTYGSAQGAVDYSYGQTGMSLSSGGHVMTGPITMYFVFYGNWSMAEEQFFQTYATSLSGSPEMSIDATYGVPATFTVHPTVSTIPTSMFGTSLDDTSLAEIVDAAIDAPTSPLPEDANGIYVVLTDKTVQLDGSAGAFCDICGYHPHHKRTDGIIIKEVFSGNPLSCTEKADGTYPCGGQNGRQPNASANGANGTYFDQMAGVIYHEMTEQMTDPPGGGYRVHLVGATTTQEDADLCESSYGTESTSRPFVGAVQYDLDYPALAANETANVNLGGKDYHIQPMWQNVDRGGCVRRVELNRPAAQVPGATHAVTGDSDGNGVADLFWRNAGEFGEERLGVDHIDQSYNITQTIFTETPPSGTHHYYVYGIADFDGDHKADVLWYDLDTTALNTWSLASGSIVDKTLASSKPVDWLIKAVGDFDGDGKADILFESASTNQTAIWYNNGGSINFSALTNTSIQPAASDNIETVGTGDFTGDGKVDILWHDLAADAYFIWSASSTRGTFTKVAINHAPFAWIPGVADIDQDGVADILGVTPPDTNGVQWVTWIKMTSAGQGAASNILAMPATNWRFSGASLFPGGHDALLWRDRQSGTVARWALDTTGRFLGSLHIEPSVASYEEIVAY